MSKVRKNVRRATLEFSKFSDRGTTLPDIYIYKSRKIELGVVIVGFFKFIKGFIFLNPKALFSVSIFLHLNLWSLFLILVVRGLKVIYNTFFCI